MEQNTSDAIDPVITDSGNTVPMDLAQQQNLAEELVAKAREQGPELVGPCGLLAGLTKHVVETASEAEMVEHFGYEAQRATGRNGENSRNGHRPKSVLTDIGPVEIAYRRIGIVRAVHCKEAAEETRLDRLDRIIPGRRGSTTGEVSAYFTELYGANAFPGRCLRDHG